VVERLNRRLWAPKVRTEKIWQLYQNDARGLVDETLLDDVGLALFLRCESVLLVSAGRIKCPECRTTFPTNWHASRPEAAIVCPTCGWSTTGGQYHASWRHQDLIGVNAAPAFRAFVDAYPSASSPRAKMLLVDQLIHAFHYGLQTAAPHRSAANNLIEGSHDQVLALLDRLSADAPPGDQRQVATTAWRQEVAAMRKRRRGEE
jgi:ribosomal protein L37AE/L43A